MSRSSGVWVGLHGLAGLSFLPLRLRPESVAIITIAWAALWHALSGGTLAMVIAAVALMSASSGL